MSLQPNLASLRQLLAEEPSWSLWNQLVEHLDQWPEPSEKTMVVEMVKAHTEHWSKGWRQGNHQWPRDSIGWELIQRQTRELSSLPDATEVWCPPADYAMGKRILPVQVQLQRGFWALSTPVTQEQWTTLLEVNPSHYKGDDSRPVENVSWFDSCAFCNALSRAEGLEEVYEMTQETSSPGQGLERVGSYRAEVVWRDPEANGYRLPTEFEWEWAGRAGSLDENYGNLDRIAWWAGISQHSRTHSVASQLPNAFGLFDIAGNVYEWNWSHVSLLKGEDILVPTHQSTPETHVYRGGNFACPAEQCHVTYRSISEPEARYTGVGFRVFRNG